MAETIAKRRDPDTGQTFDIIIEGRRTKEQVDDALNAFLDTGEAPSGVRITSARVAKPAPTPDIRDRLVQAGGMALRPFFGERLAPRVAEFITPETRTQAAAEAGLIGAAILFPEPLTTAGGLVALAARVGVPALAAAITAGITGEEDPVGAGLRTAAFAGAPELLGVPGRAVGRRIAPQALGGKGRIISTPVLRTQRVADARSISDAISKEVPAFKTAVQKRTGDDLLDLLGTGDGILSKQFQKSDDTIVKAFGDERITLRTPVPEMGGRVFPEELSARKALKIVKEAKDQAREAVRTLTDVQARPIVQRARIMEESLRQNLGRKSESLLAGYDSAVGDFRRGKQILEILEDSKAVVQARDPKGATFDMGLLQDFMVKNVRRFPQEAFPELWQAARRGGPTGGRDLIEALIIRGFLPGFGPLPGGAITLPLGVARRTLAGEAAITPALVPGAAQLPTTLATLRAGAPTPRRRRSLVESPFLE